MPSYTVNKHSVAHARRLIDARHYVVESDWATPNPLLSKRTTSWNRTCGTSTANGTSRSPTARATKPRRGTASCSATSSGCTARASSHASTEQPSGSTRRSSWQRTTSYSASTTSAPNEKFHSRAAQVISGFESITATSWVRPDGARGCRSSWKLAPLARLECLQHLMTQ
jgi:hypothetical protein